MKEESNKEIEIPKKNQTTRDEKVKNIKSQIQRLYVKAYQPPNLTKWRCKYISNKDKDKQKHI